MKNMTECPHCQSTDNKSFNVLLISDTLLEQVKQHQKSIVPEGTMVFNQCQNCGIIHTKN